MTPEEKELKNIIARRAANVKPYSQGTTSILGVSAVIFINLFALSFIAFIAEGAFNIRLFLQISVIFLLPGFLLYRQWRKRSMNKRAAEYLKIIGIYDSFPIKKLAGKCNRSENKVVTDLKYMIDNGIILEAYIDNQKGLLIFADITNQDKKPSSPAPDETEEPQMEHAHRDSDINISPEAREIVTEGLGYANLIKQANDKIEDKDASESLNKLAKLSEQIFDYIARHPDKISEVRKLMNYHLPMTIKLANAFKDIENIPIGGKNVENIKKEIRKALRTIDSAFENVLDNLCRDMSLDITSDIAALNAMLEQDGLLKNDDFKRRPKRKNNNQD